MPFKFVKLVNIFVAFVVNPRLNVGKTDIYVYVEYEVNSLR